MPNLIKAFQLAWITLVAVVAFGLALQAVAQQDSTTGGANQNSTGSKDTKTTGKSPADKGATDKSDQKTPAAAKGPDQSPIESQILAFGALRADATQIYDRVSSAVPNKTSGSLVVFDTSQYMMIPTYRAFNGQFGLLVQAYCSALKGPQAPGGTPGGAGRFGISPSDVFGGVQSASTALAGLLDTLKTSADLTANNFTVADDALVAEVANLFKSKGIANVPTNMMQVFYPAVYPFSLATEEGADAMPTDIEEACGLPSSARVMPRLYALLFLRNFGNSQTSGIQKRVDELDKAIADLSARNAATDIERSANQRQADNARTEKEQGQGALDQLKGLDSASAGLLTAVMKVDDNGGVRLLNALLGGERLATILQKPGTYTLQLKIQKSGGEAIKKSNLFLGTRFYYGGGSIVSFFLFDPEGAIMSSGNFWSGRTYVRDKALKKIVE